MHLNHYIVGIHTFSWFSEPENDIYDVLNSFTFLYYFVWKFVHVRNLPLIESNVDRTRVIRFNVQQ